MIFALDNGQIGLIVAGIIAGLLVGFMVWTAVRSHLDKKHRNGVDNKLLIWHYAYGDYESWNAQLQSAREYYARKLSALVDNVEAARAACVIAQTNYEAAVAANKEKTNA